VEDSKTLPESVQLAVVGGGVTGLTAALLLREEYRIEDLLVLEACRRVGGNIHTERTDGFVVEHGPNGFLDNVPETLQLARRLELQVLPSNQAASKRFLAAGEGLIQIPTGPLSFLFSPLLSLRGRLRVFAEPFARRPPPGDQTVFDFAERRIGREAAETLVDTMVLGVYAGDSRELSLQAAFPKMARLEREYGSLVRALIALSFKRGGSKGGPAGPGGKLTSFPEGMTELVQRLESRLQGKVALGAAVKQLEAAPTGGYLLHTAGGMVRAQKVLIAVPASRAAALLSSSCPAAASLLRSVPSAPVAVVALAFKRERFPHPLNGFGFLVPRKEGARLLGCLWSSSIFSGRAPQSHVLLRCMYGGLRDPAAVALPEGRLLELCLRELSRFMGKLPEPDRWWIFRYTEGISQYPPGHLARLAAARLALSCDLPGVVLAGSSFEGISINLCVVQAGRAAAELTESRRLRPD